MKWNAQSVAALVVWVLALAASGKGWGQSPRRQEPTTQPAVAASLPDHLAAMTLSSDAQSLGHARDAVGWAGRVLALLQAAQRLWPDSPEVNAQLIDLYEHAGSTTQASEAARDCLRARPDDFALAVRWIKLGESLANQADERSKFLTGVLEQDRLPAAARAAAAADLCGIYLGRGDKQRAADACRQALALDAYQPAALAELAALPGEESPLAGVRRAVATLRGNPRSLHVAWEAAQRLQGVGLYDEAMPFYEHALALAEPRPPTDGTMEALLVDCLNNLLDARQPDKAVQFHESLPRFYGQNLGLRALMVEAYRAAGREDGVKVTIDVMSKVYEMLAGGPATTAPAASRPAGPSLAELAWFDLMFADRAKPALQLARQTSRPSGVEDRFIQRVLGAAELIAGQPETGVSILEPLLKTDPYAAALLARHYFAAGKADVARQTLLAGADVPRTGPGWRLLAAVAAEHKVELPPLKDADAIRDALKAFPASALEMGRYPQRFVKVKLSAGKDVFVAGEPVEVVVELANTSNQAVPLGQWGLFNPVVYLSLSVEGDLKASLPNVTVALLRAPKYLPAGETVTQRVRLDTGPAGKLLATAPLANLKLTVAGVLDPLPDDERVVSSVPEIAVAPLALTRAALFDTSSKQAGQLCLAYIVNDLKQGDLPTQLRAARRTGALLAHVRLVQNGKTKAVLPDVLTEPVLLSMTRAFLQSDSATVRAEMLSALMNVDLDERIISLLNPGDPSPLARLRLIELLAGKRTPGYETLLAAFLQDKDPLVRQMAAALRP